MFTNITFEERIYSFIKGKLDKDESIESERLFGSGRSSNYYRADLYLPRGCKALSIPARSIIELKRSLRPDTLYVLLNLFKEHKMAWNVSRFYVIFADSYIFSEYLLDVYKKSASEQFYVLSESEFVGKEKVDNISVSVKEDWLFKRKRLISDAHNDFSQGHNTFFFGAGLGPGVNMPTWNELLGDLMDKAQKTSNLAIGSSDYKDIDESCNHSALIIGRYIESGFDSIDAFKKQMHASLYKNSPKPNSALYNSLVKAIQTKKVEQVITFNYDDLIETALEKKGIKIRSIFERSHYSGPDFPIYHVHGMIPQTRKIESTPVLSEKEYHTLYKESFHWSNVIQLQALSSTTCFFIGLSMNDPNLRRLLDISQNGISRDSATDRACHYAILERKPLNSAKPNSKKDDEHFAMQERMMEDFGINIIWYEHGKYNEIPVIIDQIYR